MRDLPIIAAAAALTLIATAAPAEMGIDDPRAAALERLVRQDCGSCHGMTLRGGLGPDLTAGALSGADLETLAAIILDGVPGKAMPPWRGLLTTADAVWIARYLLAGERP